MHGTTRGHAWSGMNKRGFTEEVQRRYPGGKGWGSKIHFWKPYSKVWKRPCCRHWEAHERGEREWEGELRRERRIWLPLHDFGSKSKGQERRLAPLSLSFAQSLN